MFAIARHKLLQIVIVVIGASVHVLGSRVAHVPTFDDFASGRVVHHLSTLHSTHNPCHYARFALFRVVEAG